MFGFFCNGHKALVLKDIGKLNVEQQMKLVEIEHLSTYKERKQIMASLYKTLPELKNNLCKRIQFKSILLSYYLCFTELQKTLITVWTPQQTAFSLFIHFIDLQKQYITQKTIPQSFWQFTSYFLTLCNEETYDGISLIKQFYQPHHGKITDQFISRICNKHSLNISLFNQVEPHIQNWVKANQQNLKKIRTVAFKQLTPAQVVLSLIIHFMNATKTHTETHTERQSDCWTFIRAFYQCCQLLNGKDLTEIWNKQRNNNRFAKIFVSNIYKGAYLQNDSNNYIEHQLVKWLIYSTHIYPYSPIAALFDIYSNKPKLNDDLQPIVLLSMEKQFNFVKQSNIDTTIQQIQYLTPQPLNIFFRIRLKSVLSKYHKHSTDLETKTISLW
eukprot:176123_1